MKTALNFGKLVALIYMLYVGYFLVFKTTNSGLIPRIGTQIVGIVIWFLIGIGILARLVLKPKKDN